MLLGRIPCLERNPKEALLGCDLQKASCKKEKVHGGGSLQKVNYIFCYYKASIKLVIRPWQGSARCQRSKLPRTKNQCTDHFSFKIQFGLHGENLIQNFSPLYPFVSRDYSHSVGSVSANAKPFDPKLTAWTSSTTKGTRLI
jgi:hypothetical protein